MESFDKGGSWWEHQVGLQAPAFPQATLPRGLLRFEDIHQHAPTAVSIHGLPHQGGLHPP